MLITNKARKRMMDSNKWCKCSLITESNYILSDGSVIDIIRSETGRFYAKRDGKYWPGGIWILKAELEKDERV
jgi:hypothetical protein